ncbi:MAG: TrmH family RNA methyltransferase [Pseudomonadota bacterium]
MRLVAVQPDIAGNVGAMIRVCACFGARFELVEPCGFAFSVRAVRRTGLDYAEQVEIVRHDSWTRFLDAERDGGARARLVLLTTAGAAPLWSWRFEPGDAILVGRESAGAPPEAHEAADARLRIPMAEGARSLNVAIAAAVALAEARRQLTSA